MKSILKGLAGCLVASVAAPSVADAAIVVNLQQVGGDVVATTTGSLDLTGLTSVGTFALNVAVRGIDSYIGTGTEGASVTGYSGFSSGTDFGTGSYTPATSGAGDLFAFNRASFGPAYIFVAPGYLSGSAIASSATFVGSTLSSLGLTSGTYTYSSANDTLTVNIGALSGAVPEPATWAMMMLGFGAIGFATRRRRAVSTTVSFA